MEWSKNILTGKKSGQEKKLFQTKVDRRLSDEFRIICISLGKSQSEYMSKVSKLYQDLKQKQGDDKMDTIGDLLKVVIQFQLFGMK